MNFKKLKLDRMTWSKGNYQITTNDLNQENFGHYILDKSKRVRLTITSFNCWIMNVIDDSPKNSMHIILKKVKHIKVKKNLYIMKITNETKTFNREYYFIPFKEMYHKPNVKFDQLKRIMFAPFPIALHPPGHDICIHFLSIERGKKLNGKK